MPNKIVSPTPDHIWGFTDSVPRPGYDQEIKIPACLDEGIDIPACSTAYILASSRDPRQFVQRRGRILRKAPGKESAVIYDFIVTLNGSAGEDNEYAERLMRRELERVAEFASLSQNRHQVFRTLRPLLNLYDLEHLI